MNCNPAWLNDAPAWLVDQWIVYGCREENPRAVTSWNRAFAECLSENRAFFWIPEAEVSDAA